MAGSAWQGHQAQKLIPGRIGLFTVLLLPRTSFVFFLLLSNVVICLGSVLATDENQIGNGINFSKFVHGKTSLSKDGAVSQGSVHIQADTFVEFYTGLSDRDVDKQTQQKSYSQLIDKLKLDRRMGMIQTEDTRQASKIHLADRLYSAINYGRLPDTELVEVAGPVAQSYWMQVKGEIIQSGSLLEIGDCVTAFQIAADHPNITVIAIVMTETNIPFCSENARSGGLNNFNLGFVKPEELGDLVEKLYSNPQVLFGNVFLSNLTQLSQGLLPHELEELLARIHSLSPHTLVMNSHVGPSINYFTSQWTSLRTLLLRSCHLGGLACTIDSPYGGSMWKHNGTLWKVRVNRGARDLPVADCNQITKRPDCVLLYSNDSAWIQTSDGRTFPFHVDYSTVPLGVLLDMNPVLETRQKLFGEMLMLPRTIEADRVLSTVSLSGGSLTWAHQTVKSMTTPVETNGLGMAKDVNGPDMPENGVRKSWDAAVGSEDGMSVKQGDGGEISILEDKWQSNDNHHGDSEIQKEGAWSDGIDQLWNHVWRGKVAALQKGAGLRKEPKMGIGAAQQEGDEPGMTKDEEELHQAIGFLHGENNLKYVPSSLKVSTRTATPSPSRSTKTASPWKTKSSTASPDNALPRAKHLRGHLQKMEYNNVAAPNLARPPEQPFIQKMQANLQDESMKEEGTVVQDKQFIAAQAEQHPLHADTRPSVQRHRKAPVHHRADTRERFQMGQRNLLMFNQPSVSKTYISSLEEHSAQLRSQIAARQGNNVDPAPQSVAMVSNIRVESIKNVSSAGGAGSSVDDKAVRIDAPKTFHHAFTHRNWEHQSFDHYWRILKPVFVNETEQADPHFNLLTFGGEGQSLLGLKVATTFPGSSVISVMSAASQPAVARHRKAMKTLTIQNCMLMVNDMESDVLDDLTRLPELFRFQVLGVEVFTQLLMLGETFLHYLGQWLILARTTILEVPRPEILQLAYTTLSPTSHRGDILLFKGMVEQAIRLVGGSAESIRILAGVHHHGYRPISQRCLLRVDMDTLHRQVFVDCGNRIGDLQLRSGGVTYISSVNDQEKLSVTPLGRSGGGVGLEFILRIGPSTIERKSLFMKYLSLPVYRDMCPYNLVYFNETLIYHDVSTVSSHLSSSHQLHQSADTQSLLRLLIEELGPEPFSFMEYNSDEGSLISSLAAKYQNSTFVSLQEETTLANKLYKDTKREQLENLVICELDIDRDFTQKMLKSPDFLRYQFISTSEYLTLMKKTSRLQFNRMLGEILATSVTTFIQVPSATIFSLAMSTFFPEKSASFDEDSLSGNSKLFLRESHPLPLYRDAELKFLKQSAKADVNITISATVLSPSEGSVQPWRVIRVDVRNMSVQVDHHFDYSKDGHSRKYRQHCVSHNKTSYEVFLIREQDGFKIPYGNVHAISLIALLRIGILEEIKAHFYDKFLKLPLYEDMAPWNIVFQAGRLDYIDYDSKDVTFDKMVPAAYQILAMLMNYERTIKDFGHCSQHAKNQYQFKLISNCVGSPDFDGPCKDSRYPVPCGDHTCRSTFIECLQVLNKLEKQKSSLRNTEFHTGIHSMVSSDRMSGVKEQGEWSFNAEGAVREA